LGSFRILKKTNPGGVGGNSVSNSKEDLQGADGYEAGLSEHELGWIGRREFR